MEVYRVREVKIIDTGDEGIKLKPLREYEGMTPPSEGRYCGCRAKFVTKLRQRHFDGAGRAAPGILQQTDPPAGKGVGGSAPQAVVGRTRTDRFPSLTGQHFVAKLKQPHERGNELSGAGGYSG
jgi:hypothetical protein